MAGAGWSAHIASATTIAGRASVIDGDTLEIHGQRIRLFGIDAPESGQSCQDAAGASYRCGQRAALALADKIGQAPIACEQKDVDRYRRIVAVCRASSTDLNGWMVAEGLAVAYRQFSTIYVAAENEARIAKRGVWAGSFTMPADWRRQGRSADQPAPAAQPTGCVIKGNVSSSGARIYHMPGGRFYEATRIDTAKGERWFCGEAEAQSAGWRRSRQ